MAKWHKPLPAALALVTLVTGVQVATSDGGRRLLRSADVAAPEAGYTQLEFLDHLSLPRSAAPGATLSFRIKLINREGGPRRYAVSRRLSPAARKAGPVVRVRDVNLPNDNGIQLVIPATMPRTRGRVAVDIVLEGRTESLRAWIAVREGG